MYGCDRAARLAPHHLPLCVRDRLLHSRAAHLNNAPSQSLNISFAPSSLIFLSLPFASAPPAHAQLKHFFPLPFSSGTVAAARSSLCTPWADFIWFDKILFWEAKLKGIPPLTPPPTPHNPRPKKGEKYVDFIFTWLRGGHAGRVRVNSLWGRAGAAARRRINRHQAEQLTSNVFSRARIYCRTGFTSAVGTSQDAIIQTTTSSTHRLPEHRLILFNRGLEHCTDWVRPALTCHLVKRQICDKTFKKVLWRALICCYRVRLCHKTQGNAQSVVVYSPVQCRTHSPKVVPTIEKWRQCKQ